MAKNKRAGQVIVGRKPGSSRFSSTVTAPGLGPVKVISRDTFRSALVSASRVLRESRARETSKSVAGSGRAHKSGGTT